MKELKIKTELQNRENLFKVLAVGLLTKLPVLLIGEKGTGKTQAFFDFVSSVNNGGGTFFRQLNFDTRAEDLVGYLSLPDLKKGKIVRINGVQHAEFILLDEIDKASSSVRNLFLSLLREKKLFDGGNLVECKWKLLAGTTNRREFEEDDEPFIDRFVLKYQVERLSITEAEELLKEEKTKELIFTIREEQEIQIEIEEEIVKNLTKILPDIWEKLSDRTIAQMKKIAMAFLRVNDLDVVQSVIDTIAYTVSIPFANTIIDKIGICKEIIKATELANAYENAKNDETKKNIKVAIEEFLKKINLDMNISTQDKRQIRILLGNVGKESNKEEEKKLM